MKHIIFKLVCCLLLAAPLIATPIATFIAANPHADEYIQRYQDLAVREMKRSRIPASITLAQGMFESKYGQSELSIAANNHFGIKCKSDWTGATFYQNDDQPNECFKKYETAYDSYMDHSDLLKSRTWYQFLFLLEVTDYKSWAAGLQKAGYATDSLYAEKLIEVIERHQLHELDKKAPAAAPVIFAQTIGINSQNESALQDYHGSRLRGETSSTASNPQEANTPHNPATKPQRSADLPQSGMFAMETAFSEAEATRPAGTQRQSLTGAPVVAINPQDIQASRLDPRRPTKANESPTTPQELRPLATDDQASPTDNTTVAYFGDAPTRQTNAPSQQSIPLPAAPPTTYTPTTVSRNTNNSNSDLQNVSDSAKKSNDVQFSYQPAVQTADAQPNIVLAAYRPEETAAAHTATATAPTSKVAPKTTPQLTIINERRAVIYPYEITLSDIAVKHDTEISLLQDYNKDVTAKTPIAAGTPIFLQAPFMKGY